MVECSQEPKEKEVPTKLFTSISLLGYKTGQNRVKNGWGKDHTENNEFAKGDWISDLVG